MGRSSTRTRSPTTNRRNNSTQAQPVPQSQSVPQAQSVPQSQSVPQAQPVQQSTMGDAIKSGVGMGLGIEAVRGAMGMFKGDSSNSVQNTPIDKDTEKMCESFEKVLINCMNATPSECTDVFNAFQLCKKIHEQNTPSL